jgi:hypothetical protein
VLRSLDGKSMHISTISLKAPTFLSFVGHWSCLFKPGSDVTHSKSESLSCVTTHQNPDFCKTSGRNDFARTKSGGLQVDIPSLYLPKVHDCVLGRLDAGEILGINRWPMWNTGAVKERDFAPRAPLLLPHLISHQRHPSRSTMKVKAGFVDQVATLIFFPYLTALLVILGRKQLLADS